MNGAISTDSRTSPPLGNPAWTSNWTHGRDELRGELIAPATSDVWLAQEPMTRERYAALSLPDGFFHSGIGRSVADTAYFRRSPGAEVDGPLETMEIDGIRFALVARPGMLEASLPGVFVLPVYKHHRVLYRAGRTLEIMDCGDGADYVPLVAEASMGSRIDPPSRPRVLPEGWSVRSVTLTDDLLVDLPCPTRVTFFKSGHSFQGPLRLDL